jgi:hypothetical protein
MYQTVPVDMDEVKRLQDFTSKVVAKAASIRIQSDQNRLREELVQVMVAIDRSLPKIDNFQATPLSFFGDFWARHIIVDPESKIQCSALKAHYDDLSATKGYQKLNLFEFPKLVLKKGVLRKRSGGPLHYMGIRLRTILDPPPEFPGEVVAPQSLKDIGYALMITSLPRPTILSDTIEKVINWVDEHYEYSNSALEGITSTDEMYEMFSSSGISGVSKENFEASLGPPILDSYPSDFRWLLPEPDGSGRLFIEVNGVSETRHLFEQRRRRWISARKRETTEQK